MSHGEAGNWGDFPTNSYPFWIEGWRAAPEAFKIATPNRSIHRIRMLPAALKKTLQAGSRESGVGFQGGTCKWPQKLFIWAAYSERGQGAIGRPWHHSPCPKAWSHLLSSAPARTFPPAILQSRVQCHLFSSHFPLLRQTLTPYEFFLGDCWFCLCLFYY